MGWHLKKLNSYPSQLQGSLSFSIVALPVKKIQMAMSNSAQSSIYIPRSSVPHWPTLFIYPTSILWLRRLVLNFLEYKSYMSQSRRESSYDLLMPFQVIFPKDNKCDGVKVIFLFLSLASLSLVLYSSLVRHDLWFRSDLGISFNPACHYNSSLSPTNISHIVFGIAGSSRTWKDRKNYSQFWWKPNITRGFVWLEEELDPNYNSTTWPDASPPYRVSSDWRKFKFTSSQSAVRISRVVVDSFRVGLPNVRWFVMGDDDTIFFPENLATVLAKYDHRQMYYIGGNSESLEQNVMHAYNMAFGGGGFAISSPLAEELVRIMDGCLNRYFNFYGSDQRVWACVGELGVSLTKERGFHQGQRTCRCLGCTTEISKEVDIGEHSF